MQKLVHSLQTCCFNSRHTQVQQSGSINQERRIAVAMVKIGDEVQALHGADSKS